MNGSRISGVGIALPAHEIANEEIAPALGVDDAWIYERTGIRSRRVARDGETTTSLGALAATDALHAAGVAAKDIDLVVCATITPDVRFPATGCLIQSRIGAAGAAFDVNAGCAGFLFALAQADNAVRSGAAGKALVVGAEVLTRITDPTDRSTAILFGDGAGAVVVEASPHAGIGPFVLRSEGSRPELLHVDNETDFIVMNGREIYRLAVASMAAASATAINEAGHEPSDVDLVVAHQANRRIIDAVARRLALAPHQVFTNVERYGNTSAASIPIALFEAQASGRLREDDIVVLTAFGAGLCWGATSVRWSAGAPTAAAELIPEAVHA